MIRVSLITESDFTGWRAWTRSLLQRRIATDEIYWEDAPFNHNDATHTVRDLPQSNSPLRLPKNVQDLIPAVIASGHPERFSLLYQLLEQVRDHASAFHDTPIWGTLTSLAHTTRRAALSLRQALPSPAVQPGMVIVRLNVAPSLLDSQAAALVALRPYPWLFYTPGRILLFENDQLFFSTEALDRDEMLTDDELLKHARSSVHPVENTLYWTSIFPLEIRPTPRFIEQAPSLDVLRAYATDCSLCSLCASATRTIFGEGNTQAEILFVGEQPGDQEDQQGRPFIGPAGQLFDRALHAAGGDRAHYWVSNAVKHFNFIQRGNRRIHQKPEAQHTHACNVWLDAERRLLRPRITVMLGVTGASAILGRTVRVTRERSQLFSLTDGSTGLITVHPSSLLRQPDEEQRQKDYIHFINDLKLALSALA